MFRPLYVFQIGSIFPLSAFRWKKKKKSMTSEILVDYTYEL